MRIFPSVQDGLRALALLSLSATAAAHSWIEVAYKVDTATRKFFGSPGYPRGGNFRELNIPDDDWIWRLPHTGSAAYSGNENINKRPFALNSPDETLEAAPGDYIAILHYENGHVSVHAEGRPLNAGTIYLYGTSEPKDEEKLFDVHLVWNEDGTGGDGRGRLLGTRNYDDGQCFEGNPEFPQADARAKAHGGYINQTLACQSDIQLPKDLKPGSVYTIYWYWDWPILNPDKIDMEGTKKGLFPWAGTFMRGEKDPHGFTMSALASNESYSSTLDIKIVDKAGYSAKETTEDPFASQPPVYGMAIKEQLQDNNFQVAVDFGKGGGGGADNAAQSSAAAAPSPSSTSPAPAPVASDAPQSGNEGGMTVTVTEKVTAAPTTVEKTVTVTQTAPSDTDQPASPTIPCKPSSTQTVVEMATEYTTVYPGAKRVLNDADGQATPVRSPTTLRTSRKSKSSPVPPGSNGEPEPTPSPLLMRSNWSFGKE